ncbi:hypothetical protein mRhiFer1_009313 [Rhinolophus ferrumequinum]|uniref:Uncharacterized protein n=1 Tax=Rhinolophus ferrumequinum TaxID=59479 RepID=A0A7J7RY45_RHIFE|nr:hypothetical protein mRhiFer1_009313 [Rhinolophus ferrumequinum]
MLPPSPPPPTHCFPGLHPHPATAPGVFTTWNNRGLEWGGTAAGRRGYRAGPPPEGSPKTTQHQQEKLQIRQKWGHHSKVLIYRHCISSREVGGQMGQAWVRGGQVGQPRTSKGRQSLHPTSTHIPSPPLVTKALQGAPGGEEFPLGIPRERGSPVQPCFSAGIGATCLSLVGHEGNNELKCAARP